jgi:hypothetical protein
MPSINNSTYNNTFATLVPILKSIKLNEELN